MQEIVGDLVSCVYIHVYFDNPLEGRHPKAKKDVSSHCPTQHGLERDIKPAMGTVLTWRACLMSSKTKAQGKNVLLGTGFC